MASTPPLQRREDPDQAAACPFRDDVGARGGVRPATPADRRNLPLPPGPTRRRWRLREFLRRYPSFTEAVQEKYGDIAFVRMPPFGNYCIVSDADLIRDLALHEDRMLSQQADGIVERAPSGGLQVTHDETHRRKAAILGPAFTAERANRQIGAMQDRVTAMIGEWSDGETIEIQPEAYRLAAAVLLDALVGRDLDPDPDAAASLRLALKWEYAAGVFAGTSLVRKLPLPFLIRARKTFALYDDLLRGAIERSGVSGYEGDDLITYLVQYRGNERPYTRDEIHDELYYILIGSQGVLGAALTSCFHALAWNPGVQGRLRREADEILGGRPVTEANYGRLVYTQATTKEILRLAPGAWAVFKRAKLDLALGDFFIPKGTIVHPCLGIAQRRAEHYEDANEFRPERWLGGTSAARPPHAWVPFSQGLRVCPGADLSLRLYTILLASLARHFRLTPSASRPSDFNVAPVVGSPYRVTGALRLRLAARGE